MRVSATQATTLVIGAGNVCRGDDGAGIFVARQLRERIPAGVTIIEESGEGAALMAAWTGAASVFVVDAVCSGAQPGAIHRFDAHASVIPRRFFQCSTHAFGVAEAVELARVLSRLPARLVLYGIEGGNFSAGADLSVEVENAAGDVVARILKELGQAKIANQKSRKG